MYVEGTSLLGALPLEARGEATSIHVQFTLFEESFSF